MIAKKMNTAKVTIKSPEGLTVYETLPSPPESVRSISPKTK